MQFLLWFVFRGNFNITMFLNVHKLSRIEKGSFDAKVYVAIGDLQTDDLLFLRSSFPNVSFLFHN